MSVDFVSAIVPGYQITKEKRQEMHGVMRGGASSMAPENYQRKMIEEGTKQPCKKTNKRINLRSKTIEDVSHPNKKNNGFDYTEDFDGEQSSPSGPVLVNLKCIVGKGGSQTRSLREVYWFAQGQLDYLLVNPVPMRFANILDGDEASAVIPKFKYLLDLPEYQNVKSRVYVGDLRGYFDWFNSSAE
jgi:hypothetical protein